MKDPSRKSPSLPIKLFCSAVYYLCLQPHRPCESEKNDLECQLVSEKPFFKIVYKCWKWSYLRDSSCRLNLSPLILYGHAKSSVVQPNVTLLFLFKSFHFIVYHTCCILSWPLFYSMTCNADPTFSSFLSVPLKWIFLPWQPALINITCSLMDSSGE